MLDHEAAMSYLLLIFEGEEGEKYHPLSRLQRGTLLANMPSLLFLVAFYHLLSSSTFLLPIDNSYRTINAVTDFLAVQLCMVFLTECCSYNERIARAPASGWSTVGRYA